MSVLWSNVYRFEANAIGTAANIASGHGRKELANSLWAFEAELRQRVIQERDREAA